MITKAESKETRSDAIRAHNSVFPYTAIDLDNQKYWVDMLDNAQMAEDQLKSRGFPCPMFQKALTAFRLLEETHGVRPSEVHLVDCLSNGGAVALGAVCFGFGEVTSIDITKRGKEISKGIYNDLRKAGIGLKTKKVTFLDGAMQDYLPLEANMVFCNVLEQGEECLIDEGMIVQLVFDLSERLITGTILVILTSFLCLDSENLEDMGVSHIRCLQSIKRRGANDCNIWILQTMVPPRPPAPKKVLVVDKVPSSNSSIGSATTKSYTGTNYSTISGNSKSFGGTNSFASNTSSNKSRK